MLIIRALQYDHLPFRNLVDKIARTIPHCPKKPILTMKITNEYLLNR